MKDTPGPASRPGLRGPGLECVELVGRVGAGVGVERFALLVWGCSAQAPEPGRSHEEGPDRDCGDAVGVEPDGADGVRDRFLSEELSQHVGFSVGGFSPGAVGAFVPANASVNAIAVGNGNCGVHGPA